MYKHPFYIISVFLFISFQAISQQVIPIEKDELWYGGSVNEGDKMPFKQGYSNSLIAFIQGNQAAPLLISNKGRYVWSDQPFSYQIKDGNLIINEANITTDLQKSGTTLRDAYLAASAKYFPASGKMPDSRLFTAPQYNTWIELIYNQNQKDILKYAEDLLGNGYPPGVLMIDDNWAPCYGKFEFRKDRFPDAKGMIEKLHLMGFTVMLWVSPFISPDSEVGRQLIKEKLLLMSNEGNKNMTWEEASHPALVNWWNGWSCVLDFSNPEAVRWFDDQLKYMMEYYGLDGFKLDAGDPEFYTGNVVSFVKETTPNDHCELFGLFGLKYPLNEYRAMWKRGGEPIAERLRDKFHTWEDVQKLIPHITVSGLLGYAFTCPDMIGGGDYSSFMDVSSDKLDQELIVRSAQCHALMPMMQFSVAPWRVLNQTNHDAVKKAVALRQQFVPEIMKLADNAAKTGEPIVRNMEYQFPEENFAEVKDQFMLGENILVAPMVTQGTQRDVKFPKGTWADADGKKYKGGKTISFDVPIDKLLWFRKIK